MAKIKNIFVSLLGEGKEIPLKCSAKGVFTLDFPPELWNAVSSVKEFTTMDAAESELRRVVAAINTMETQNTDLIFYRITGTDVARFDDSVITTASVALEFVALRRQVMGKRTTYYLIRENTFEPDQNPDGVAPGWRVLRNTYTGGLVRAGGDAHEIPFTLAAMDFLKKMRGFILELRQKMHDFSDPGNVLPLLADGPLALPFTSEKHD